MVSHYFYVDGSKSKCCDSILLLFKTINFRENAFTADAFGWGIQLTNCGNWRLQTATKLSTSINQISCRSLNLSTNNIQSLASRDERDSKSATEFKTPGKWFANKVIRRDSHQSTIWAEMEERESECVPPHLLIYATAVVLSKTNVLIYRGDLK